MPYADMNTEWHISVCLHQIKSLLYMRIAILTGVQCRPKMFVWPYLINPVTVDWTGGSGTRSACSVDNYKIPSKAKFFQPVNLTVCHLLAKWLGRKFCLRCCNWSFLFSFFQVIYFQNLFTQFRREYIAQQLWMLYLLCIVFSFQSDWKTSCRSNYMSNFIHLSRQAIQVNSSVKIATGNMGVSIKVNCGTSVPIPV